VLYGRAGRAPFGKFYREMYRATSAREVAATVLSTHSFTLFNHCTMTESESKYIHPQTRLTLDLKLLHASHVEIIGKVEGTYIKQFGSKIEACFIQEYHVELMEEIYDFTMERYELYLQSQREYSNPNFSLWEKPVDCRTEKLAFLIIPITIQR
jgi:hypothetical protein